MVFWLITMCCILLLYTVVLLVRVRRLEQRIDRLAPSPLNSHRTPSSTVPAIPLEADMAGRFGLSAEGQQLVRMALQDGQKIKAVKFVCDETGMALKEAKRYVETLGRL